MEVARQHATHTAWQTGSSDYGGISATFLISFRVSEPNRDIHTDNPTGCPLI